MKSIKLMLLSIVIILSTIVIQLYNVYSPVVVAISILGFLFAIIGYVSNDDDSK